MGLSDTVLNAMVGQCSECNIQYVTSAEILCDDSHVRVAERYACPGCYEDQPRQVVPADDELGKFAADQLDKRLYWKKPDGLKVLSSEEF